MPLGTEQVLVAAVSTAAVVMGAVFAGIWWNVGEPGGPDVASMMASPAPFHETPFCEHLIEKRNGQHQIIIRANPLPDNPPPPPDEIVITVKRGAKHVGEDSTDIFGCATVWVPGAGSFVFEATVQETDEEATHRWWSNAITRYYDGESPGFIEVRLNNYARYGAS
ncbi:MAG TPA: hypothetical protein VGB18_02925 [Candidatus Thermoplasmatota archaeon]